MHGRGIFTWSDGKQYEGEYINGKKVGQGIYTWPDGRQHDGNWQNGMSQHGFGVYHSNKGVIQNGGRMEEKRCR